MISPVAYGSPNSIDNENENESIHQLAKSFEKRAQIASKEQKEQKEQKETNKKNPTHFIRPLKDIKLTIKVYEPPTDSKENDLVESVNIANLSLEEGPPIKLVPKTVRVGKTVNIPLPRKK